MGFASKSRGSKRSSASSSSSHSYASTISTVVFIALCVLGVWTLTSNSVRPPQSAVTTRTADTVSADDNKQTGTEDSSSSSIEQIPKTEEETDKHVFDDNPGQLPSDAIKPDDANKDAANESETDKGKDKAAEENPAVLGNDAVEEQMKQKYGEAQLSEKSGSKENQQDPQTESNNAASESEENKSTEKNPKSEGGGIDGEEDGTKQKQEAEGESERKKEIQETDSTSRGDQPNEAKENQSNEEKDDQPQKQELPQDAAHEKKRPEKEPQVEETKQQKEEPTNGEKATAEANAGGSTLVTSVIPKESTESMKSWATQAKQSENEKERRKDNVESEESVYGYTWDLCNVTAGCDYIPCLDNVKALKQLPSTKHFQHRERHCPEELPTCLVAKPEGYQRPISWPKSRNKIWYHNVPHTKLADFKGHQNWVKVSGEFLTFPGGGTQFIHGALHYIDFLQEAVHNISWGKHTRVVLDVGCGVASFGGFLFDKDVLTMSFAPKDEHEAQVQFALERGIPAISAVMGSQRLPFPSRVFDLVHCARCRVPWHEEGGRLLLEVNRVLRPGGYFVWSATPVYRKGKEDREIWQAMTSLTRSMCWELVTIQRDELDLVAAAFYRKPTSNECYENREDDNPPMCKDDDDANAAWYVPLQTCMHRVPVEQTERGAQWPEDWPRRLQEPPYWLSSSQSGIYGKPAPQDFVQDYEHWKKMVSELYMNGLGISWSNVRNVMDMRAVYGGFAAALKDHQIWVMNVVNINSPDTLPIIYERGLFGIYHDWCESFSTYPRTFDLLHADHLFSNLKKRCKLVPVMAELDRIVRPGGKLIVRDESSTVGELENLLKSLHWEVNLTFSKDQGGILSAQKGDWRPSKYQTKI